MINKEILCAKSVNYMINECAKVSCNATRPFKFVVLASWIETEIETEARTELDRPTVSIGKGISEHENEPYESKIIFIQQVNEMKKNHFTRRTFAIYNDLNAYNHVKCVCVQNVLHGVCSLLQFASFSKLVHCIFCIMYLSQLSDKMKRMYRHRLHRVHTGFTQHTQIYKRIRQSARCTFCLFQFNRGLENE